MSRNFHASLLLIGLALSSSLAIAQPSVATGGVLNAASFTKDAQGHGTAVAPGGLVAIFGSFPGAALASADTVPFSTSLGGVSITFNGTPAALKDVVPSGAFPFVNAQVPVEVGESGTVQVVVTINNVASAPQAVPIAASAPGIFTIPPTGQGNAVLVFVDTDGVAKIAAPAAASSSIGYPTAPIRRGTSAFFYATGIGLLTPGVVDGDGDSTATHTANHPPTVLVGGITAEVDFAGQAPFYPGVNQINIVIPQGAPTGDSISLVVKSADGTVISNTATIAVQ